MQLAQTPWPSSTATSSSLHPLARFWMVPLGMVLKMYCISCNILTSSSFSSIYNNLYRQRRLKTAHSFSIGLSRLQLTGRKNIVIPRSLINYLVEFDV